MILDPDHLADEFRLDQDWARSTVSWSRRVMRPFFDFLTENNICLSELTPGQFSRLLAKMRQDNLSWSSRNGLYTAVGAFYRWLFVNGHIDHNIFADRDARPPRPRKEKRIVRTLALSYIQALITTAERDDTPEALRNAAILRLLISTGMRRMEIAGLVIPDIDFESGEISIRGKFNDERLAFISPEAEAALRRWLDNRPATDNDKVFIALRPTKLGLHHPLRPEAISKIVQRLKREANIPEQVQVTPHRFRHTFASEVAKSGNPFALQQLLGHSDIKTTEIYVATDKRELRRVADYAPKFNSNSKEKGA